MPRHLAVVINSLANPKWQSQPLVSPSLLPSRGRPLPRSYQHDRRRSIGCQRGAIHCCPWTNSAAVAAATWVSPSGLARRPSLPPVKTQKRHSVVGLGLGPLIGHSLPKSREGDDVVNTNYHSAPRSIVEVVRRWNRPWNGMDLSDWPLPSRDPPYDWRHFLLCRT